MMKMQDVLEGARQLSPVEQLDLIRALSESLLEQYQVTNPDEIPASVRRTKPASDPDAYATDFWPDDESVEDLIAFVRRERAADKQSD